MAAGKPYRKILVPVDGSRSAAAAVREAARVAGAGGRLRLIHIFDERLAVPAAGAAVVDSSVIFQSLQNAGRRILEESAALAGRSGLEVETEILSGGARGIDSAILREATRWGTDAIVMGTHGRSGVSRLLLGSVAEGVLRGSKIPLLLVPAPARRAGAGARKASATKRRAR